MFKKLFPIMLSLCLLLSLAACSSQVKAINEAPKVFLSPVSEYARPVNCSTVMLISINPKIRLYIDKNGIVLAVEPVNDDAKEFVDEIAFENADYQTVITGFISAANSNGYINGDAKIEFEIEETDHDEITEASVLDNAVSTAEHTAEDLQVAMEVSTVKHSDSQHNHDNGNHNGHNKPHKHNYSAATCTEAAICSCGDIGGEPLGHSWAPVTCETPKRCTTCGTVEGTALGHSYTDATCTSPRRCTTCGDVDGNALGHNFTDATCTTPKSCTICGKVSGHALGHRFTNATCTTPKSCSVCGTTEGSALGHSFSGNTCTTCGTVDPNYRELTPGIWQCLSLSNNVLYRFQIAYRTESITWLNVWSGSDIDTLDEDFRNALLETPENLTEYQGKLYYLGAGDGIESNDTINGDSAKLNLFYDIFRGEILLQRISGNQYIVVYAKDLDYYFNQNIANALPAGSVFTWISY